MSARDPILAWRTVLATDHGVGDDELDRLDDRIAADVSEAAEAAEAMPPSDPAGLLRFVYAEEGR